MSRNQLSRHQKISLFNVLFDPLFIALGKIIKLRKFPSQLRSALIALLIVTVIAMVMYGATITGVVMLWYAIR
jgi:hypothetical protein